MGCEICGKEIFKPVTIDIDGTQFDVCNDCVSLGKKVELPEEPRSAFSKKAGENFDQPFGKRLRQVAKTSFSPSRASNFSSPPTLNASTLIEDYGKKIMQARQRKNLTLKELAMKLYEKESVIQRIESEKFKPSDKVIKKLEKELEISLTE